MFRGTHHPLKVARNGSSDGELIEPVEFLITLTVITLKIINAENHYNNIIGLELTPVSKHQHSGPQKLRSVRAGAVIT